MDTVDQVGPGQDIGEVGLSPSSMEVVDALAMVDEAIFMSWQINMLFSLMYVIQTHFNIP